MWDISDKHLKLGLNSAVALQLVVIGLFYFNIIHVPDHDTGSFRFHHGGDEVGYFQLAQSILNGTPVKSQFSLGFPLMLIPWLVAAQPTKPLDIEASVAIFHAVFLFPLAQILFLGLARRILQNRAAALLALLIWTVMPLILFLAMALMRRAELGAIWAVHLPWPQMLSDPPAVFLTLLSFWLMFRLLDTTSLRRRWLLALALGVVCGLAMLVRINTLLTVAVVFLILAIMKRWSALVITGLLTLLAYSPQLIYNAAFFGTPFTTGYQAIGPQPGQGLLNLSYPLHALMDRYAVGLWIAGLLLIGLFVLGTRALWRRSPAGAVAIGLWWAGYLIFFSLYSFSWEGSFTRFMLPAYPALAVLLSALSLPVLAGRKTEQR